ncbi:MAG: hypothetical protein M3R37_13820 [Actinomycetota bacterium]|nr:hypothetical protein [Actinomycetota bacterium]
MSRKLTAVAVLAAIAVTLAAVAAAGPAVGKQRVAISVKGANASSFVLTALTSGAIQSDSGAATFCCWTERHIVRDGQAIDINNPQMTLTGKRGTLVARSRIGYVDVPDGLAVFTGTWKVISGTGAYAGLAGGGRGAGVALPNGNTKARFEGFLSPK